ncbi:alpha/beta hydrolase [Nocardia nova]|uniref:Alpha/beta hydrolase n=2 Tax=Nocardia nova TaxID=37330 RepID=A0A2S5ZYK7_9NOCA|nr:alpha/beta hydrolase [Nocardia nova]
MASATIQPVAAVAPVDDRTLPVARRIVDQVMRRVAPALDGTTVDHVRAEVDGVSVHADWVRATSATDRPGAILYVHGGGFVAGSARGYRGVASRLSMATRMPVFVVDYRLAPEHPSPAAQNDVAAAYRWLLHQGYEPDRIIVSGDSAGGFLAADFVVANARGGAPAPAGMVLFSPMADLGLGLAGAAVGRSRDAFLSHALSVKAVRHFTVDPVELCIEPGCALPPTLIQYGGAEFFAADAVELADRLRAAGAHCDLQVWPDQTHVFQMMPALVPEAHIALRAVGRYTDAILAAAEAAAS